jgi:hypothetical protein
MLITTLLSTSFSHLTSLFSDQHMFQDLGNTQTASSLWYSLSIQIWKVLRCIDLHAYMGQTSNLNVTRILRDCHLNVLSFTTDGDSTNLGYQKSLYSFCREYLEEGLDRLCLRLFRSDVLSIRDIGREIWWITDILHCGNAKNVDLWSIWIFIWIAQCPMLNIALLNLGLKLRYFSQIWGELTKWMTFSRSDCFRLIICCFLCRNEPSMSTEPIISSRRVMVQKSRYLISIHSSASIDNASAFQVFLEWR